MATLLGAFRIYCRVSFVGLWPALLILISWTLLAWSLLAVVRTPVHWLWKPGVAATEWGHWLGWFALSVGVSGVVAGGVALWVVPAFVAAALFHLPLCLALRSARMVRESVIPLNVAETGSPGAFERRKPLAISSLIHIPVRPQRPTTCVYTVQDGTALTLDLYEPPAGGTTADTLVLVVHGGSWTGGDSAQLSPMNRYLAERGYAVAALNYRLAPQFRFPAPVEDIRQAIGYLRARRERHRLGGHRFVLLGRSSGGHLALLAAYGLADPSIRGVIALYAPTDLVWSWQRPAPRRMIDSNAAIHALMGGTPDEMHDRFEAASPICLARPDLPATLLIHGGRDELVSPLQSRRLANRLRRVGTSCVHIELPWGKHGMDANLAGPAGQMTLYAIERFLRMAECGVVSQKDRVPT